MVGRIWASLILINPVIWSLVWFLQNSKFLGDFQPSDSYKNNSYKKETVYIIIKNAFEKLKKHRYRFWKRQDEKIKIKYKIYLWDVAYQQQTSLDIDQFFVNLVVK